ncbi:MAG: hypothetical protein H6Q63_718 [Firmicutes bacterium]|nr:hypothetical protein [Bacillota bacterium]
MKLIIILIIVGMIPSLVRKWNLFVDTWSS